ncbi:MAG: AI-2E family transporter [Eubacteriales bacterium]
MNSEFNHPETSKKHLNIAAISLSVMVLAIGFYFFVSNITQVVAFLREVNDILTPVYAGAVIAFLLSPIHEYFFHFFVKNLSTENQEKKRSISNGLAIFVSQLIAFFVFYLLLAMLLPELYLSIENLFNSIPEDFSLATPAWLAEFFKDYPDIYEKIAPVYESTLVGLDNWIRNEVIPKINSVEEILLFAKDSLLPHLSGVMSGVTLVMGWILSFFLDTVVSIIVSVYLLARKRTFAAQGKKFCYAFLPVQWADFLLDEIRNAYNIMSGFINGKLLDSFIVGIIALVGAYLLGLPYVPLVATIIGVTNIIPFFGPFIGGIPCGILIFLVSPMQSLYFFVFIVILQQFDGNILGPKILGDSTGLSSFWVLFSIILFSGLFGLAGMILGVPVFATIYSMLSRLIKYQLKKKNMPEDTYVYERKDEQKEIMHSAEYIKHAAELENNDKIDNSKKNDKTKKENNSKKNKSEKKN